MLKDTTTTIVGIGSTYRSAKILVQIDSDNGLREVDELNILHDGTTVELLEYGQITTVADEDYSGTGLGTYIASMSTGPLNIDFVPNAGVACTVDTLTIAMAAANTGAGGTGIGTVYLGDGIFDTAFVDSSFTAIPSASSPLAHKIAEYEINNDSAINDHNAAYYLLSVEDTTNNVYEVSEVIVLNDSSEAYITEYASILSAGAGIGTVGAAVSSSTSHTQLMYTPNAGIAASVRVFQMGLEITARNDDRDTVNKIDLTNASISVGYGDYTGTDTDVLRAFNLQHDGRNIFQRDFDGSDSTIVNLTKNTVTIPEHFYVTGEEVQYSYATGGSPIGIATTTISGYGSTDLFPSTTYIVKIDERTIKFAKSAEDALKAVPNILHLSSVGAGVAHTITAQDQNTKCIIALDNAIQSPIVATAVTTGITTELALGAKVLETVGVTSFFGGDLIRISEEIMKINTVGYGGTNKYSCRSWLDGN